MDERRTLRVSEAIKEDLIELIGFEMQDPRLLPVEVNHVKLTPDGRHAHVSIKVRGDEKAEREGLAALEHAQNFLRHQIAERLSLRHVPELHFAADSGGETLDRIEVLLQRARKTRGEDEKQSSK